MLQEHLKNHQKYDSHRNGFSKARRVHLCFFVSVNFTAKKTATCLTTSPCLSARVSQELHSESKSTCINPEICTGGKSHTLPGINTIILCWIKISVTMSQIKDTWSVYLKNKKRTMKCSLHSSLVSKHSSATENDNSSTELQKATKRCLCIEF